MAFGVIGLLALAVMIVFWFLLPPIPNAGSGNFRDVSSLFSDKSLRTLYLATFLIVAGHFTAFTYLAPFWEKVAGLAPHWVPILLFVLGLSGIGGGFIASRYVNHRARLALFAAVSLISVCLFLLFPVSGSLIATAALCAVWGASMNGMGLLLQSVVLRLASKSPNIGISIYSGTFNIGIGGGSFIGGMILNQNHLPFVGFAGTILLWGALLTIRAVSRRDLP